MSSRKWRKSKEFTDTCLLADWNKDWVESLFQSIEGLHRHQNDSIRMKLTRDYVSLLRCTAREN